MPHSFHTSVKHARRHRDSSSLEKHSEVRKKRRRQSSSDSSRGFIKSPSEKHLDEKLKRLRKEKKKEKRLARKQMKELETPEEKRARHLARRLRKEAEESCLPPEVKYTNSDNPFNDPNLTSSFVWHKKLEVEGKNKLSRKEVIKSNIERTRKNLAEVEELKRNREARESAREDLEMIKRDEEKRLYASWDCTEEEFHLRQAQMRSQIRLQEGRGKPIDFLARYISYGGEDFESKFGTDDFELVEPIILIKTSRVRDLEDLSEDLKVYKRIDCEANSAWWTDLRTIVMDELNDDVKATSNRDSINKNVLADIEKIITGKSLEELIQMEDSVQAKIRGGAQGVDVAYWERILQYLSVEMAKVRVSNRHKELVQLKSAKSTKSESFDEVGTHRSDVFSMKKIHSKTIDQIPSTGGVLPVAIEELEVPDAELQEQRWRLLSDKELELVTLTIYERANYSPTYGDEKETMPCIEVIDEAEDERRRTEKLSAADRAHASTAYSDSKQGEMLKEARRGMKGDEAEFSVEEPLEVQTYLWSDRYRPRKPRYFNRVHTGFEWNKYNQTHYDMDNPPPKIVQGYRFNIFYPDLLDASQTPSFKITQCEDADFAILRFHAGPPYEDIAFKVVNREWEISHKHGYKCQFAKGIFQLWFFFKRYRYRR